MPGFLIYLYKKIKKLSSGWISRHANDALDNGLTTNSNELVDLGDQISLSSQDTTDLYFTCVEIHDDMSYVDMYTGETPNSMPGFTALMVSLSIISASFVAVRKEEE